MLGTEPAEVAAIRNVGGRVTAGVLNELVMLRGVTQAAGGDLGAGWELVVLHHTDCGITRLADRGEMLAGFFGVDLTGVPQLAISDPEAAVRRDMEVLHAETRLGAGIVVSGLVYDVATGRVERVDWGGALGARGGSSGGPSGQDHGEDERPAAREASG